MSTHYEYQKKCVDDFMQIVNLPLADEGERGCSGFFDPWPFFGLYGHYSADFNHMAISVLKRLERRKFSQENLAENMFAELLCSKGLCEYGTSPRVCFPTGHFQRVIGDVISKWVEFDKLEWGE